MAAATSPLPTPHDALGDDVLKRLAEREAEGRVDDLESLAGTLEAPRDRLARTIEQLARDGWVVRAELRYELTEAGRMRGRHLLRSHRLLETRLARETGMAPEQWHAVADRAEHALTPEETNALADALGNPRFDPHGDPIPDRDGRFSPAAAPTLLDWPEAQPALIVHLEDEPPALYANLHRAGLAPGTIVHCAGRTVDGMHIEADGRTLMLSLGEADLVHVAAPAAGRVATSRRRLADLPPGGEGVISALAPVIRGRARQRLLDLGLLPGTRIVREFTAALRSPIAFRVRGTLVALRREQTEEILIEAGEGVTKL
jgi:DtxR family Mn-dependent transcriptional regulator